MTGQTIVDDRAVRPGPNSPGHDRKALVVEPGPVRLLIGASSADIRLRAEMVVQ